MTSASLSHWELEGHTFRLKCTAQAIEELRNLALTADLFPLERGTLWGTREGQSIYVRAIAPPSAEKRGNLIPVGWFQIRLDANVHLTADDVDYHDEKFPDPGSVALILRPASAGAVRVGVFFREVDRYIRTASSYQEVVLSRPYETGVDVLQPGAAILPRRIVEVEEQRRFTWVPLGAAFLAGGIAGALAFAAVRQSNPSPAAQHATQIPVSAAAVPARPAIRVPAPSAPTQKLQAELAAERVHSRRLEATVAILRDRGRSKSAQRADSLNAQSMAQQSEQSSF